MPHPYEQVREYWIKALGVSDVSGLRAALPRLLVREESVLTGNNPTIGDLADGDRFHQVLFGGDFPPQEKDVCFCYCVPRDIVATNLTRPAKKDRDDENSAQEAKRARGIIKGTEIVYVIPASLHKDGSIVPRRNGIPMIVREHLEPGVAGGTDPIVGDYATFLRKIAAFDNRTDMMSMASYWKAAQELFRDLSGRAPGTGNGGLGLRLLLVEAQSGFATRHIQPVYARTGTDDLDETPLLRRLLETAPEQASSQLPPRLAAAARSEHIAMVDRSKDGKRLLFPLDPSQRRALHNVVSLGKDPGIIAVSGPPGTGKTDMLRAIIANRWVSAALGEGVWQCPFTIVCGATNQSVRNVMGAFGGAARPMDEDVLKARWIEGISDYASIFSAQSRLEEDGLLYQTVETAWLTRKDGKNRPEVRFNGLAASVGILGRDDLPRLTAHYLSRFETAFPQYASAVATWRAALTVKRAADLLQTACHLLRQELRDQVRKIETAQRFLSDRARSMTRTELEDWIARQGEDPAAPGCRSALGRFPDGNPADDGQAWQDAIEGLLDVTLRSRSFHLAARYWEGCWLGTLPERQETGALADHQVRRDEQIRRLAMLTPCVVSTLHSAPRLFVFFQNGQEVPGWSFADLLVVDEAGQAAPELGAAMFALARQALVVGDVKQLPPVTQMVPPIEEPIAAACQIDLRALQESFLDSGAGSVMAMAMRASARSDPGAEVGGIRLRNHYRCAPTIIGYCIALKYSQRDALGDELVPQLRDPRPVGWDEPDEDGFPLPPMAFVQSGSPDDEPEGEETKWNRGEAIKIADWLAEFGPRLVAWQRAVDTEKCRVAGTSATAADVPLEKLVAIVTPFRGQVAKIKELLRERFGQHPDPVLQKIDERITVGTVHVLQGAESPVVLFSAVNMESVARNRADPPEHQVFVDRDGGNLLNVAVSRAQKSFVLFGHSDLFFAPPSLVPDNDLPSALLGRYLAGLHDSAKYGVKIGPKALVIVESTAKARVINEVLGSDYIVFGTGGHIRDLANLDLDEALRPTWTLSRDAEVNEKRRRILRRVGSRLLQTRHVILATDADAEGEAIAWHVLQILKEHPWWSHVETLSRVTFSSLDREELLKAFAHPMQRTLIPASPPEDALHLGQVHAALLRALVDAKLGAFYFDRFRAEAGRIAAPLTRLLAANLGQQPAYDPAGGWCVDVVAMADGLDRPVNGALVPCSNPAGREKTFKNRFSLEENGPSADAVGRKLHGAELTFAQFLAPRLVTVDPPSGLSTKAILVRAWRRYGFLPGKTMKLLQKLYERELVPPKSGPDAQKPDAHREESPSARLVHGRMQLTPQGKANAAMFASGPVADLSDVSFAKTVAEAIERVRNSPDSFRHELASLTNAIAAVAEDRPVAAEDVAAVTGEFPDGDSLWEQVPTCVNGQQRWREMPFAGTDLDALIDRLRNRVEDDLTEPADSDDAHPSLAPLSLARTPDDPDVRALPDDLRKLYELVWGTLAASVLHPVRLRVTPLVLTIPGLKSYFLRVEAVEVIERGFLLADRGAEAELYHGRLTWQQAQGVRDGSIVLNAQAVGDPSHHTLARQTPDQVISTLASLGLGRPSTYASHVEGVLDGS